MLQQNNKDTLMVSHLIVLVQGHDHRILAYPIHSLITITRGVVFDWNYAVHILPTQRTRIAELETVQMLRVET